MKTTAISDCLPLEIKLPEMLEMIYRTKLFEDNIDQGDKILILSWLINHLPRLKRDKIHVIQIYFCSSLWPQNKDP